MSANGPLFFTSYARADVEHPPYRKHFDDFIRDLSASAANRLAWPLHDAAFVDSDIHIGDDWSDSLRDALTRCRLGVALYSPNYFSRRWCGKEFQVLLSRKPAGRGAVGIIPVIWEKSVNNPPECASKLQYNEPAFPPQYFSRGMRQLTALRSTDPAPYEQSIDLLTDRIVTASEFALGPLVDLDLDAVESAWDLDSTSRDSHSLAQGNVSKACFVFVGSNGWDWAPYQGIPAKIGAVAQKIAGELGLKYEEIPCDQNLLNKLKETKDGSIPTVLIGDPSSFDANPFAESMRQYDNQYFLNCAIIIPWEPEVKFTIESDSRWIRLCTRICPQKIDTPPPYHEWRSIFSYDELNLKTKTLIEQIRSRLLKALVAEPKSNGSSIKIVDTVLSDAAASIGINTASLAQLESPNR